VRSRSSSSSSCCRPVASSRTPGTCASVLFSSYPVHVFCSRSTGAVKLLATALVLTQHVMHHNPPALLACLSACRWAAWC
jgi:hypothetical protein